MFANKSSSFSALLLVLSLVLGLLIQSSQAVCVMELVNDASDICAFSLPDCSNITVDALSTIYGLEGMTVTNNSPRSVRVSGSDVVLIKAVLAPYLQGCYAIGKRTMTLYGISSSTA
ncbi:hypothetical protein BGZ83_002730 [Gryganskiella cystojenkinii]|nr:hypothetical protein BGZ83_002730 [Gryganskiella cystojenkinii]